MLVLSRRKQEGVVIGDEVKLIVEEILNCDDGQRIIGAAVRLGFQSPRHVTIYRDELCRERSGSAGGTGRFTNAPQPQPQPPAGKVVEIPDAQVRLRIQVPPRIPVSCNGQPLVALAADERSGDEGTPATTAVHRITCHKDDRITICHNITISALDVHRFVFSDRGS